MMPRIYLDFNATAPLCEPARAAMVEAMGGGNPSSIHEEGRQARDRVERARVEVARLVGRGRDEVVFTSGGTEANWLGVHALAAEAEKRGLPRVAWTPAIEHPSLLAAVRALKARGWDAIEGRGESDEAAGVVAVGLVNHELGAVVDRSLVERTRARGALVHLDAVQAIGKVAPPDADSIAISAHKIGGPQGVGAVVTALDVARPGTENVLGIVGFGAAAASLGPWSNVLAERLVRGFVAMGARIHGAGLGTVNAGFPGARGQDVVIALDLAGIAASTGAACASGTVQPSPVLLAMGYPREQAEEAVRFSLGRTTTEAEIDEVLRVLPAIVERARRHR